MIRSGVFIGVNKTGNLQQLNDAAAGARRMYEWALSQGMADKTHAKLITDADGQKVTPDQIYDAICEIINGAGADQLILYFAGHGVNINRNEKWLLTDAPVKGNAAVDVAGSVELARYCGIGYIVVISDACRVAPEGIQAQSVHGVEVFPNETVSDKAKPVDQFFACLLGKTAAEIKDPAAVAASYSALYTNALLDGLNGKEAEILDPSGDADDKAYYIRPVRLEEYLEREVPLRIQERKLERIFAQNPDAIITAHSNWISRVLKAPPIVRGIAPKTGPAPDLRYLSRKIISTALEGSPTQLNQEVDKLKTETIVGAERFAGAVENLAAPFGPDHFETGCGIKVRGTGLEHFAIAHGKAELVGSEGNILRIQLTDGPASVLLRFKGGMGTVVPAVPGFVTALSFHEGELADVAYEPSRDTDLWQEFIVKADELRNLRGVVASSSQYGRFRLDKVQDPLKMARKLQFSKGIDPSLAIYAAYAYYDLQKIDRIREMMNYLEMTLRGAMFFDLPLLSRMLVNTKVKKESRIIPFVPLFSQGWPLLRANRVRLHHALNRIEPRLRESVWSLFDAKGVDMLEQALMSGEVL